MLLYKDIDNYIWCRPDRLGARKMFSASKFWDGSNCTIRVGKEHTFCWRFGLLKAFFRIVCAPKKDTDTIILKGASSISFWETVKYKPHSRTTYYLHILMKNKSSQIYNIL